ncbi:MAG: SGNH/GDSL hydrolase family protein [Nocardioides sp.]|nr:SGNH/GDSL hydrolase family protein [Nocardioides sp.]
MAETSFDYSNLSGRPTTPLVSVAGLFLPGVREVQRQVAPYARAWEESNRRALAAGRAGGPLWVAIGDSMTQGIGASAHDRGWVGQLAGQLPERYRIVNLAFNGARAADVLERQLPAMQALGVEPDLVTVMIGSNDLVSRRWRPLLPAAMSQVLARLPAGSVVVNQPGGRSAARELNRLVDRAVENRGLRLADFRDPRMRSWRGKVAADHFHPNDAGYAGMAEIMGEAVRG